MLNDLMNKKVELKEVSTNKNENLKSNNANNRIPLVDSYNPGRKGKLKIVEAIDTPSAKTPKNPSVILCTLFGVLADFGNPTRNNRQYTKELWENVLKDPLFLECMQMGGLLAEADHPLDIEDRVETHIPKVSHIVRDVYIDYDDNTVKGYIDVLDTPDGRILKTLIDYGYTLGVSSRGSGEVIEQNGQNIVNPDTYQFVTFDIVARPSNKAARVNPVNESLLMRKPLSQRLKEQIEVMIDEKDTKNLLYTEKLLERLNVPNKEELFDLIDEGINYNKDTQVELNEALDRVMQLKDDNDSLLAENQELQEENDRLLESLNEKDDTINELRKRLSIYSDSMRNNDTIVEEDIDDGDSYYDDEYDEDYDEVDLNPNEELLAQIRELRNEIRNSKNTNPNDDVNGNTNSEELQRLNGEYDALSKEFERVQQELKECQSDKEYLLDKLEETMLEYLNLRCSQLNLNESFVRKQFKGNLRDYELSDINEGITSLYKNRYSSSRNSSVNESYRTTQIGTTTGTIQNRMNEKLEQYHNAGNNNPNNKSIGIDVSTLSSMVSAVRGEQKL